MNGPRHHFIHPGWDPDAGAFVLPDTPHLRWSSASAPPFEHKAIRFLPEPSILLLQVLSGLLEQQPALPHGVPADRMALVFDGGTSFDGLQAEFYAPIASGDPRAASALLFPHTSELSAASAAAICLGIGGPVLSLHGEPEETLVEEAVGLLDDGTADVVILAATQFLGACHDRAIAESFARDRIPFCDCAAAVLLTPGELAWKTPARRRVADLVGRTGACELLFRRILA